jgi:hypothetical protein
MNAKINSVNSNVKVGKLDKKARIYSHVVQGQTIKTGCKTFGACLQDESGNFYGACSSDNCCETNEVRLACQIASGILPVTIEEVLKSGKRTRNAGVKKDSVQKDDSVFESFVKAFKNGKSKSDIISLMIDSGMAEKASLTLFSKLNCITIAIRQPNLKDSTIYQVARFYNVPNSPAPTGDKSSIAFCTRVNKAWLSETAILKRDI